MSTRQQCIRAEAGRIAYMQQPFPSEQRILDIAGVLDRVYDHALRSTVRDEEFEYGIHIKDEPIWADHEWQTFATPEKAREAVAFLNMPDHRKVIRRAKAGPWEEMP